MTSSSSPSPNGLDFRVVFETPLRQFVPWLVIVLLIAVGGYPGIICLTPMAWLMALRVGSFVALRSLSELSSQRLTEAALAGGLLGLLQGILFGIISPFMGPIQTDEWTRTIILIIGMLIVGTLIDAGLAYTTAYLIEQKRKQRTIDFSNK